MFTQLKENFKESNYGFTIEENEKQIIVNVNFYFNGNITTFKAQFGNNYINLNQ
jgi:hypothetical protein